MYVTARTKTQASCSSASRTWALTSLFTTTKHVRTWSVFSEKVRKDKERFPANFFGIKPWNCDCSLNDWLTKFDYPFPTTEINRHMSLITRFRPYYHNPIVKTISRELLGGMVAWKNLWLTNNVQTSNLSIVIWIVRQTTGIYY